MLATSNGHSGMDEKLGSTSSGSVSGARRVRGMAVGWVLWTVVGGAVLLVGVFR